MRNPNAVEAALAGNALAVSALEGNSSLYDRYLEHMKTAKTPEEYYNYFGALSQFPGAELAKRTIDLALSPDAGSFCDEKLRDDSQDFFASQNLPGSERPLQNAKDSVNACIELRALQQANLSAYLKKSPATAAGGASHQ
jgi:hypothetical protein